MDYFSKKMDIEAEKKNLKEKNSKHQSHKKILALEVKKLREDNNKLENTIAKYRKAMEEIRICFHGTEIERIFNEKEKEKVPDKPKLFAKSSNNVYVNYETTKVKDINLAIINK